MNLHWLLVNQRIEYKLLLYVYRSEYRSERNGSCVYYRATPAIRGRTLFEVAMQHIKILCHVHVDFD